MKLNTLKETESSIVGKLGIAEKSSNVSRGKICKTVYEVKNLNLITLWLIMLKKKFIIRIEHTKIRSMLLNRLSKIRRINDLYTTPMRASMRKKKQIRSKTESNF